MVTAQEIARAFAISDDQVRALAEAGLIVGAAINDGTNRQRVHNRFERWSVVAWRLEEMAKQGTCPPVKETPQVTWWRSELRKRNIKT